MEYYLQVSVMGTSDEAEAAKIARSVASSSLVKVPYPNWGRIACAAGYTTVPFDLSKLWISLGDIVLMDGGQPLQFDRTAASSYLQKAGEEHGTIEICISVGDEPGEGKAWSYDLSYDYVKINAEYTT
ncbi:Arginine biosynthesis bifunctional protein ArgJ chloroplastic [Bienertia sinuspersici]